MKRIFSIFLCLFILLSAVACTKDNGIIKSTDDTTTEGSYPTESEPETVIEYHKEHSRINDLCGSGWLVDEALDVALLNDNTFRFSSKVTKEERVRFISAQQKICDILSANGVEAKELNFFVLKGISSRAVGETHAVYIDLSQTESAIQVILTLQAIWGEYTNYGYLYALSDKIAQELFQCAKEPLEQNVEVLRSSPEHLNLLYPSFTDGYASEEQIKAVKALSSHILSTMNDVFAGESAFLQALNTYADTNELSLLPTKCQFAYGGGNCPLKIKTDYLDIYLDSDYQGSCQRTEQSVADDPLFNLSSMLKFLAYLDGELRIIREKFNFSDSKLIPVYMTELSDKLASGANVSGWFIPDGNNTRIEAESIYALSHEYVHYIDYRIDTDSNDDVNWCAESLACYFGNSVAYLDRLAIANSGDESSLTLDDLSRIIGKQYESPIDEIRFQNIMNAHEENHRYSLISLYNGRLSFGDYFVQTYGEEAFIECMISPPRTRSTLGLTMDEIVDGWCIWLEQFNTVK